MADWNYLIDFLHKIEKNALMVYDSNDLKSRIMEKSQLSFIIIKNNL